MLTEQQKAIIQLIIGSTMISFSAVFVKLTTTEPTVDGFYRMFFGGIFLLFVLPFERGKNKFDKQALLLSSLGGLLFAADLAFWHKSILNIGPGLATVLVNLQVFVLAATGFLVYGDKINKRYLLALPLAAFGLYFLVGFSWNTLTQDYKLGVFQSLISMCCYSFYIITLRKSQHIPNAFSPILNLSIISLTAAILLGILAHFQHESFMPTQDIDWFWLVNYGIFGQMLGWLFVTKGVAKTRISQAGFILLMQPALSMLWDTLIFHRQTNLLDISGILLIFIAIYFGNTGHQTKTTINS